MDMMKLTAVQGAEAFVEEEEEQRVDAMKPPVKYLSQANSRRVAIVHL